MVTEEKIGKSGVTVNVDSLKQGLPSIYLQLQKESPKIFNKWIKIP